MVKMSNENIYTPAEEFANAFSHATGALFAIYAIVMLAVKSSNAIETSTTAVFGATMLIAFQSSMLYHSMTNEIAKRVFRVIDHSAIYLLIAGTYTPLLLLVVPFPTSVALLAMIWYLAISGIIFSCTTTKSKYLSAGLYLLMSWLSVFLFYNIATKGSWLALGYFLAGGILYSGGCVFYLTKKPFRHFLWHLCVLGGAVMHYLAISQLL